MKRFFQGLATLLSLGAGLVAAPRSAHAEDPELNPYECLGRYEAATGNRTISQINQEIKKRLPELDNKDEPKSVNAMKHCVVAMLMSRTGNGDAPKHYEIAVRNAPQEPGYELWFANHYSMFRGARSPVTETAEEHYYASLKKLDALRASGKYRAYHAVVEEWTRKRLMVLYQQDGLHLIPGKQYPQSANALHRPSFSIGAIASMSKDTRDFNRKGDWNEARVFTLESEFANADVRAGGAARPEPYLKGLRTFEKYEIPRAPLRYHLDTKLRYRQNPIGTLDFVYELSHAKQSQITSFYYPAGCKLAVTGLCTELDGSMNGLNDVDVRQMGGAWERVLPLYPLFDAKVGLSYKRVHRTGVVEFLANKPEDFNLYEGKLALSRFVGSDKITAELGYTYFDMPLGKGPVPEQQRSRHIRSALLEYALYSPLVLPSLAAGEPSFLRTPTRGWYFYAGVVQDDELYGFRTVTKRDLFLGSRFEGSGIFDITLQGTYATGKQTYSDADTGMRFSDPTQEYKGLRTNLTPQIRLINPDAIPGISWGFDSLMLVFPVSHDLGLKKASQDYDNIRAGVEMWGRVFSPVLGPAFLLTAGYTHQNFYNINNGANPKGLHLFMFNLRMGWGDL
jgi:hypothetical protein